MKCIPYAEDAVCKEYCLGPAELSDLNTYVFAKVITRPFLDHVTLRCRPRQLLCVLVVVMLMQRIWPGSGFGLIFHLHR